MFSCEMLHQGVPVNKEMTTARRGQQQIRTAGEVGQLGEDNQQRLDNSNERTTVGEDKSRERTTLRRAHQQGEDNTEEVVITGRG
jgi:hypothetical protein